MSTTKINPGPSDPSVLHSQETHRSSKIWDSTDESLLDCRRNDQVIQQDIRILQLLVDTGFHGIFTLGYLQLHRALITGLVERWRPETHTFHMPPGECTITLQDVGVLLGMIIDGKHVIDVGPNKNETQWCDYIAHVLGKRPQESEIKGNILKLTWLRNQFGDLAPNADELTIKCYTRAYILMILGGQWLANKSGKSVKLMYLSFLEDFGKIKEYSWGAATLATLYRELCRASQIGVKEIDLGME